MARKRTPSSDTTRIGEPAKASEKIPERYQASLVITEGRSAGMEYPLTRTYTVLGRDQAADIMLKDPLVSRQHAVIVYHDGSYTLKDLDSTNGTHLLGASVKQAHLRHRDSFRVGDTTLQFVLVDAPRNRTYEIK